MKRTVTPQPSSVSPPPSLISVIVPTRLTIERADTLRRALHSIRTQSLPAAIVLVANGPQVSPHLLHTHHREGDVHLLHLPRAGLVGALHAGRAAVATPFFCFLDDDDEYLPGAFADRLAPLVQDETIDAAVGRGYRIERGLPQPSGPQNPQTPQDALNELTRHNWLTSCGALFRSARVGAEFFHDLPPYCEWTYLAFRLCLSRRLAFVETAGHCIHDTPGSLSKSTDHRLAQLEGLSRVLSLDLPAHVREAMKERQGRALHDLADHHRAARQWSQAWRAHLCSLTAPGGLRFAAYTRKLFGL